MGEAVKLDSVDVFAAQLESFVNNFKGNAEKYKTGLIAANEKYSQANLIKRIVAALKSE